MRGDQQRQAKRGGNRRRGVTRHASGPHHVEQRGRRWKQRAAVWRGQSRDAGMSLQRPCLGRQRWPLLFGGVDRQLGQLCSPPVDACVAACHQCVPGLAHALGENGDLRHGRGSVAARAVSMQPGPYVQAICSTAAMAARDCRPGRCGAACAALLARTLRGSTHGQRHSGCSCAGCAAPPPAALTLPYL